MNRQFTMFALTLVAAVSVAGCAGDMSTMITTRAEIRDKVMGVIGGNSELAGQMVGKLLGADSTRSIVVDRLFTNGGAVQAVMARIARDQTMVDGVINLAVQDTTMRNHLMTLFKGMEMGAAAAH